MHTTLRQFNDLEGHDSRRRVLDQFHPEFPAYGFESERLIAEAEAARAKAMSEKGGAAAAVSALTAKAKLAGMWREKVDQHNTGSPVYERIERVMVERAPQSASGNIPDEPPTEVVSEMPGRHWSAD